MPRLKASTTKKAKSATALRKDPPHRATDNSISQGALVGADPNREYRWVPRYSRSGGVEFYEWNGWQVERRGPEGTGVRLARGGSRAKGDDDCISMYDCVLMSKPKDEVREDYLTGQAKVDKVEKAIVNKSGSGIDPIRGVRGFPGVGDYYDVYNATSGERVERLVRR